MMEAGRDRWQRGVDAIRESRKTYTPERLAYYARIAAECLAFFNIQAGRILDVGAGDGSVRNHLPDQARYVGCDVAPPPAHDVAFVTASGEALPFPAGMFDTVLGYSVLQHVVNPSELLAEAERVLRPGGHLALQVCVNDPNPIFLWQWSPHQALELVERWFAIERHMILERRLLLINARKRECTSVS